MICVGLTRRRFLAATATAAAGACLSRTFTPEAWAESAGGGNLSLNGAWKVCRAGTGAWLPASVPGCIHTDLLAAGRIQDPFYRDNEKQARWVGESDWVYRRVFRVPKVLLRRRVLLLRCEGLDTLATIRINGRECGRADNMFRTWEYDVKGVLQAGENTIEITFASPLPFMKERQAGRVLYEWSGPHEPTGRAWVRKEPCNFGWDWGPVLITCGIWRNIGLVGYDQARIEDVLILQDHAVAGQAGLDVRVGVRMAEERPMTAKISVWHQGREVTAAEARLEGGEARVGLVIERAKLWWPAGMGEQPLYEVRVEIQDEGGKLVDRAVRRIGLRTMRLVEADKENSLRFEVNGEPFFAKGANWIPADAFATRVTPKTLRRYVADAVAVNMNMLRFWGGGHYEEDALFDACDEAGICVWLDFKFACSSYPAFDEGFLENVRLEARDNLRRLRHHPCIAVWCGNNEISLMVKEAWSPSSMGRGDYQKLFRDVLGGQVKELAPQAEYVLGSPECGDIHYWGVWHGGKPFESYRSLTGFMSEFGFQSFPGPATVQAYTEAGDRESLLSPVMAWHQRSGTNGTEKIREMLPRYFNVPRDFESALWVSQLLQAHGIKLGAEHWRQTMPRSMGCVFWQYNDCWPVCSWSSVDYFGRWKALHYLARRFYAPLLVSGAVEAGTGKVDLYITSDLREPTHGELEWEVTNPAGSVLRSGSLPVTAAPRESRKVTGLDLTALAGEGGARSLMVWLRYRVGGRVVADNLVLPGAPKDLSLCDPGLEVKVAKAREGYEVTVSARRPALWAWLSLEDADARYSDNFMHLAAGARAQIVVQPSLRMSSAGFGRALRVRSLYDTYAPAGGGAAFKL